LQAAPAPDTSGLLWM